jgi:hypothetical protein
VSFNKVIVSSGHLTDKPGRPKPRFPEEKVGIVQDRISQQLDDWKVGAGDLAICGGARGGDILFAELCVSRGANVWLFISLDENDFLDQSVRQPGTDWEQRFYELREQTGVETFWLNKQQPAHKKELSPFAAANIWMIDEGKKEAALSGKLYALLVWDEQPAGDGPGGTADFAARVRDAGGLVAIVNPLKL